MQPLWLLLFCCSVSLGQRLAQKWLDPRRGPEELTRYGAEFRYGPYGTLDTRDPSEKLLRHRGFTPNDQDRYGNLLSDQQGPSEQGHWKRREERIPRDPLEGYGGEMHHGPYGTLDTRDSSEELLRHRGFTRNDQDRYEDLSSDQRGPLKQGPSEQVPSEQGHWKRPEERIPKDPLEGYGGPPFGRSRTV
ncbi:hypothetical protein L596_013127 [Steinernema carpocapsae]|uniref:Uncharacterized protein n=1 Tax=Steinernema carpocapsae TaxID=34508 RepID=A0A4U5NZR0_STECR|nr:hypothetical protein L596_013127 [Steinernema carpocapsae]